MNNGDKTEKTEKSLPKPTKTTPNPSGSPTQSKGQPLKSPSLGNVVEALLKSPANIAASLKEGQKAEMVKFLLIAYAGCMIAYGLIVGSFCGGVQWWAAPLKILLGFLFTAAICLPSLYIFSCLAEAEVSISDSAMLLVSGVTLTAITLLGFAPVAWVFSQSTNSLAFMGFLHLVFWLICVGFGMILIVRLLGMFKQKNPLYIFIWVAIFIVTSLQMMTALRPILGQSPSFLPKEKKFFMQHWGEVIDKEVKETGRHKSR